MTILFLSLILIIHPFEHDYENGRLSVTFLDVGQGDAMLIAFPRGSLIMLDAGGRPAFNHRNRDGDDDESFVEDRIGIAEAAVMPYLWRRGIKRLDWVIASHGDADHVEGFIDIARSFDIGVAMKGPTSSFPAVKLPLRIIKRGDAFDIDGARLQILAPFVAADRSLSSDNDESVVLKITFGSRSFLLTGDIEKGAEASLVASGSDLRADVLKVSHHGSKTSSTREFLEKVKPRHAVISAADPSPFGHPHPSVVKRLREAGARIWSTGSCGAITISTDGRGLRIETFVKCE
jgi:competence protein ComEC